MRIKIYENAPLLIAESKRKKALIVADLHIGYCLKLLEQGITARKIMQSQIDMIKGIIDHLTPDDIIIVGDLKHNIPKVITYEKNIFDEMFNWLKKYDVRVYLIKGNHDSGIDKYSNRINIVSPRGFIHEKIGFFHGHAWPSINVLTDGEILITAHIHPVITLREGRESHTEKVYLLTKITLDNIIKKYYKNKIMHNTTYDSKNLVRKLIVLPAFNPMLSSGVNVINWSTNNSRSIVHTFLGESIKDIEIILWNGIYLSSLRDLVRMT